MFIYHTQDEFNQATFDNMARLISEYAGNEIFAGGNPADLTQEILEHLEYLSVYYKLSPVAVSTYLDIVKENNADFDEFEQERKDMTNFRTHAFLQGNDIIPRFVTRG